MVNFMLDSKANVFLMLPAGVPLYDIWEVGMMSEKGEAPIDMVSLEAPLFLDRMAEKQFVDWCDEDCPAEYVDGKVILMPSASTIHEGIFRFLIQLLGLYVSELGLGEVLGSQLQARLRTGLRRVPDLVFVSKGRTDSIREKHIEGAPDLAVEIVSDDSVEGDWQRKVIDYENAGISEYWIIDPRTQQVEVLHLNEVGRYEPAQLVDSKYHSKAVPGFWFRPEWLWQEPMPSVIELLRKLGVL